MTSPVRETRADVSRVLLAHAGLTPPTADHEPLALGLTKADEHRDLLHSIAAARYVDPVLTFSARPRA